MMRGRHPPYPHATDGTGLGGGTGDSFVTERELEELLMLGHETAGIEVKEGFPRTSERLFWRVVRAVLAMTNHRDGGLVVIGVKDGDAGFDPTGFGDTDLATWNHDDTAAGIAPFADPHVSFTTHHLKFRGASVVALRVKEFDQVPVICTADRLPDLRMAAIYVRSVTKPESVPVRDHGQMRELLDLATEKGLRRFLATARAVGVAAAGPSDEDLFRAQVKDLR
jgi:hypothetical protein